MKVVDTSVVIKIFFPEEGSDRALSLIRNHSLIAPDLLLYEFSNYLALRRDITQDDVEFLIKRFYRLPFEFFVLPENRFIEVCQFAKKLKVTAYDASFLILAKSLRIPLITADHKFYKVASRYGEVYPL